MEMASSGAEDAPLTDYERLRLENVKRNQAMIAALRIDNAKSQMRLSAAELCRGGVKKRKGDPVAVRRLRSSTRVYHTTQDTQEIECPSPFAMPTIRTSPLEDTKQSVSLATVCIQGSSSDALVSQLQYLNNNAPLSKMSSLPAAANVEPTEFSLQKSDIARVVPERITSASFLPASECLFVVAGDKGGHLGFWKVESNDPEGDVVYMYRPHTAPISGMSFASFNATKVFTCSYDQTIKQLNVETSMFNLMYCSDTDEIVSAICSAPESPFCFYFAEGPGCLKMLDMREKRHSLCVDIHSMTINTIDVNVHSPRLIITSSTDKKVSVWDVRKLKGASDKVQNILHQKAVYSAQFSPSGRVIATCSYDNTLALAKVFQKPCRVAHPNMHRTGVSTFRAIWGWDDKYVYVGNIKRSIDIISTQFEIECHWLSSPLMTSVPSRLAAHPFRFGLLAGCSSRGEVFLWRQ